MRDSAGAEPSQWSCIKARTTIPPYTSSPIANDRFLLMVLPQVAPELAARLANYTIDDRARGSMNRLAPVLGPHIGEAITQVVVGAERLPQVAEVYRKHGGEFRRMETAQFEELLKAEFGQAYLERCRITVDQQASLGFEGRARMNSAAAVLRAWIGVLKRKHLLASAKFA